uniref:Uncharacterized protein n=1 Tax=Sphaerodactylus townsendi TaxID=933632 RepID=A0ACB8GEI3_9SAUR
MLLDNENLHFRAVRRQSDHKRAGRTTPECPIFRLTSLIVLVVSVVWEKNPRESQFNEIYKHPSMFINGDSRLCSKECYREQPCTRTAAPTTRSISAMLLLDLSAA